MPTLHSSRVDAEEPGIKLWKSMAHRRVPEESRVAARLAEGAGLGGVPYCSARELQPISPRTTIGSMLGEGRAPLSQFFDFLGPRLPRTVEYIVVAGDFGRGCAVWEVHVSRLDNSVLEASLLHSHPQRTCCDE